MPIYETTMPSSDMQKAIDNGYVCGICGGRLNIAWDGKTRQRVLRCQDLTHNKITNYEYRKEDKKK